MNRTLVPPRRHCRRSLISFALLAALFTATSTGGPAKAAPAPRDSEPLYVPGQLLVQFRATAARPDYARVAREEGAAVMSELTPNGLVKIRLRAGDTVERAAARFRQRPEVDYAIPNLSARSFFVPNDTLITEDAVYDRAWNLRSVHAYEAWDLQTCSPNIVVAIIDSGVAHQENEIPDYERENLWPGTTRYMHSPDLPGPFLPGWDFVNNDPNADDDLGHGTAVATFLAGEPGNIAGSAGIAFGATIMPIKVLTHDNRSDMSFILGGIRFAADHGANVANLSLGFQPLDAYRNDGFTEKEIHQMFQPLREAVSYAQRRGVILVAAAGNFGNSVLNFNTEVSLPAGLPGVIAVGATGVSGTRWVNSSYGRDLDFMAPGGTHLDENGDGVGDHLWCLSIKPGRNPESLAKPDSFASFNFSPGTSGAAPHVAGAVALLLSKGYTNQGAIEQTLRDTSIRPEGPMREVDFQYGYGLIQLDAALRARMPGGSQTASVEGTGLMARITGSSARGTVSLAFRTSRPGRVRVRVFDVRGTLVRTLEDRDRSAGDQAARWDGRGDSGSRAATGIYLFKVETPDGIGTRKFAFLR